MSDPIRNPALQPPGLAGPVPAAAKPAPAPAPAGPSFADVLARTVNFSKHASQRIERRGIAAGPEQIARLEEGVQRAAGKGARDAVVLVDGTAFVVSVKNRTVITAVGPEHMREHVFTNIDSAVIA